MATWMQRALGAVAAIAAVAASAAGAFADTTIPPSQVFACGTGFTAVTIGVTTHGNVMRFESPAGAEHISAATNRSGYQVCYATGVLGPFFTSSDFGPSEGGWAGPVAVSQPNGPGTFPLEITRDSSDGRVRVTRRFTGNSFVMPGGGAFDLNGNGQLCDTMAECGNCSNRTLHVLTRITNITAATLFNVRLVELADVDIASAGGLDNFSLTSDSSFVHKPGGPRAGMLLQGLIVPVTPGLDLAGGHPPSADCGFRSSSPFIPAVGNFELLLRHDFGTLGPGASTGATLRVHYRRF